MAKFFLKIIIFALLFNLPCPPQVEAVRLKDIASIQGVRDNQLVGYGLVVGLNGTGDGNNAAFTTQALANMLKNVGMPVNETDIKVSNVAGVMITATLPPFVKAGQTIDITLSSLGDASSLQGGTLINTPLKGLDDNVYAIAQGAVSIGGFAVTGGQGNRGQNYHMTVARIPNGATIEREVSVSFADKESIILSLKSPDFTTISRMVTAIDNHLGGSYTTAVDGATVKIGIPENYKQKEIIFLADIENLDITTDSIARVVLDERTGTIVIGENVRINQLAISHGNLSIQISNIPKPTTSTDEMINKITDNIGGQGGNEEGKVINLYSGATLGELVRALNSVGAAPQDLIAIFQTIKASGALQAELEII
jgi:flagellar P-ring protein precursor FlgI